MVKKTAVKQPHLAYELHFKQDLGRLVLRLQTAPRGQLHSQTTHAKISVCLWLSAVQIQILLHLSPYTSLHHTDAEPFLEFYRLQEDHSSDALLLKSS